MSNLPDEVILDILYRAPVKTVGRCRCLSKPWRSLLSRPDFITTHLNWSKIIRPESLLLVSMPDLVDKNSSAILDPFYYASSSNAHQLFDEITIYPKRVKYSSEDGFMFRVLGSCDGLLLVANWFGGMLVLNPITNEVREVPQSPFLSDLDDGSILYGFGYDDMRGEYKVVIIFYHKNRYAIDLDNVEMFVNVFSLKTGTWNKAESSPFNHGVVPFAPGAFLKGCIHWFGLTTDLKPTIVAFDMAREKFFQVSPPFSSIGCTMCENFFGYVIGFSGLTTLDECLCAFNDKTKDVWVMKEYGVVESWTKLTVNDLDVVKTKPICMFGQEAMVFKDCKKLLVYNLKEHIVNDIVVHGMGLDILNEASFVESLVSPHGANETTRQ